MTYHPLLERGAVLRWGAGLASVALVSLAACSSSDSSQTTGPQQTTTSTTSVNPLQLRNAAFIADVNVKTGAIKISAPQTSLSPSELQALGAQLGGPSLSLVSNDAIQLTPSNFRASAPSGGKIRVQFDLTVNNKLGGITLTTPTFPTAPAGQSGLLLFPYSFNVTTSSGGTGTTNGNEAVIELPSGGQVTASVDWNGNATPDLVVFPAAPGVGGTPFNFFNDATCPTTTSSDTPSDCFRYETFPPLAGGATSSARRVGFDVDATVGQFRVRILAAADLVTGTNITNGTVSGTVTSPQRGGLGGISVTLEGSGSVAAQTTTTNASGAYSFTGVTSGNRSVTLGTLPTGCTTISPLNGQNVAVTSGAPNAVQNYSVTCTALTGTITGTITRTGSGIQNLDGVTVTVQPASAGFAASGGQVLGLAYSRSGVAVGFGTGAGNGTVALSNLPSGCTAPAVGNYTGLTSGGSVAVNFTVNCDPPAAPSFLLVTNQFGAISAGTVDLTIGVDPTGYSAATDFFASYQGTVTLSGAAASRINGRSAVPTANFGSAFLGGTLPATGITAVTSTAGGFSTAQTVAVIRFTVTAGAAGTISTATNVLEIANGSGTPYSIITTGASKNTDITEASLTLP